MKALTGTDPDRLPEEQARGITIDLGFAHLELALPASRGPAQAGGAETAAAGVMSVGIVDVPGHEDFVANMVAGVGSIDVALLVVAMDDGWMPQTEEHLQILSYLEIPRAVVALTKRDLDPGREAGAMTAVRERLQRSPYADAPIVATSVVTPHGLELLKSTLADVLASAPRPADIGKPRLPVDRVFSLKGVGTVVTGSLVGGSLTRGQSAVLQPSGVATRVRSLQNHHAEVEVCGPGTRTAVNLPDVAPRSDVHPQGAQRGEVLTLPEFGDPTSTADVLLVRSARLRDSKAPAARPLKDRTRVRVHFGTSDVPATVFLHGTKELLADASAPAQLRFEEPVFLFLEDRFIVRDWSEQTTLAGGRVLDPEGDRKFWQSRAQVALLQERAASSTALVCVTTQLARDGALGRDSLLLKSRFAADEVARAVEQLTATGKAIRLGNLVAAADWWARLTTRVVERIAREHCARPERVGIPLSELKAEFAADVTQPGLFEALVTALVAGECRQVGTAIQRRTHQPALPPRLQAAGDLARMLLEERPLEPPSRKELVPDQFAQQALRFLIETGQAVEVGPDIVLSADAYTTAVNRVRAYLRRQGQATLSDLRQAVGTSRRIMVPLAEKLDRDGITVREGDARRLRESR